MSVKILIYISGKPGIHGYKRREFLWVPEFGCYLYGGAVISPSEFNAKYEKAMKTNHDLNPRVKVIEEVAVEPEAPAEPPTPPTEEFVIEKKVDEAEAVLARYAPERLKKRPPPPQKSPAPIPTAETVEV